MLYQVALVAELEQVTDAELCRVSAALQKQALRDFGPIWQVAPTVDAFISLDDVPIGYWPIIVEADIRQGWPALRARPVLPGLVADGKPRVPRDAR
jgi:hypothetical protein